MSEFEDYELIDTPEGLTNEQLVVSDDAWTEMKEPSLSVNSKIKFLNFRTHLAKVLTFLEGIVLTSGRVAHDEKEASALAAGDWNFAELDDVADGRASSFFKIIDDGGTTTIDAGIKMSASAKTHQNTTIKIIDRDGASLVTDIKIGKSDSVNAAGALLTMTLSGISDVIIQKIGNTGSEKGFELITPNQLTTLPDGVTSATFLEAGTEFLFGEEDAHFISGWTGNRLSDDVIACEMDWNQIPKQFTGMSLTLPSTSLKVFDKSNPTVEFTITSPAFSDFGTKRNRIQFRINETGIATGMANGELGFKSTGTGGKLTLT